MKTGKSPLKITGIHEPKDGSAVIVSLKYENETLIFKKTVHELYDKVWLNQLNQEDAAHIAFLVASKSTNPEIPIENFPLRVPGISPKVLIIAALYTAMLLSANLTGYRLVEIPFFANIFGIQKIRFGVGLLSFPATYIISAILTEVYGYRVSRATIWGGFITNTIIVFFLWVSATLPDPALLSSEGLTSTYYKAFFHASIITFLASMVAYLVGEFINTTIIARLKIITHGRRTMSRFILGFVPASIVDTVIFCFLMFYGRMENDKILYLAILSIGGKLTYNVLLLPVAFAVSKKLKTLDHVDHYDYETVFNPFSWK